MANKPGVMIYFETAKAVKGLDFETKGRLFDAIMEYAEDGVIPDFDGVLSAVWPFISHSIDRDSVRYDELVEKKRKAGKASAAKRQALADKRQQVSTGVDECQQIQPTSTPTPTATPTTTPTATTAGVLTTGVENTPARAAYGLYENVFLTQAEHEALTAEIPEVDRVIEKLSIHIASTGRKYESHAATVRKWAMEDAERQKRTASRPGGDWCSGITPEDYKNDIDVPW